MNPQRILFGLFYRIRFTPWDGHPLSSLLLAAVEKGLSSKGAALDLGCGTGDAAIYLARNGWKVTGVDLVAAAIRRAQRKARRAGVEARFLRADISSLAEMGLGRFQLLHDAAVFHGMPDERRDGYVRAVGAVAAPGAHLFLAGLTSAHKRPGPRGFDRAEIEQRFGADWEILAERQDEVVFRMHGGDHLQLFELRRN